MRFFNFQFVLEWWIEYIKISQWNESVKLTSVKKIFYNKQSIYIIEQMQEEKKLNLLSCLIWKCKGNSDRLEKIEKNNTNLIKRKLKQRKGNTFPMLFVVAVEKVFDTGKVCVCSVWEKIKFFN